MHVYRWDLDKTYLQTDFDSVRGLLRSATETAEDKINVPGSAALLRALSSAPGARVVIVSGSPTQMKDVLARKLQLDGIRYDELHLKDNLGNLRRGRLRAIRGQFGYKLPKLLRGRKGYGSAVGETLFGDDAEVDALVYSVFADVLAGKLSRGELSRIMEAAGAYPDQITAALDAVEDLGTADAVRHIFIHLERRMPPARFRPLGGRVVPVYSWFQAALVLYGAGQLDAAAVVMVSREVLAAGGWSGALVNHFQDVVRRGHLRLEHAERLTVELAGLEEVAPDVQDVVAGCRRRVGLLGGRVRYLPPVAPDSVDYIGLLKTFNRKAAKAKGRE